MEKLEVNTKKRRLTWLGYLHRMQQTRIPRQALNWNPKNGQKKRGRPQKNWKTTVCKDLEDIGLTWDEAEIKAQDRLV